jgi:hypothetical protein
MSTSIAQRPACGRSLRRQLLAPDVHEMPLWDTFVVTGPIVFEDRRGRTWYEYRASVQSRGPFDR